MRLDKYVADAAALTRSEARKAIKSGLVCVDNSVVRDIAFHIDEEACVSLSGEKILYKKYVYIMLNKPKGFVSATEDKRQKTVLELIDASYARYSLFPVGRLDVDTEGFLLLTNDGEIAHNMLSPSKKVGKTYLVHLKKEIEDSEIEMLENGVDIGECVTMPAKAERIAPDKIRLTITEGKFHQIKRMAHAVGNEVVYLKRLAYGKFYLDESLGKGEYRHLTDEEVHNLYNVYKRKS